jgi:signal peptidase I
MVAAALNFAIAWGIHKRHVGAALFGAGVILVGTTVKAASLLANPQTGAVTAAVVLAIPCAAWTWMLVRAAFDLRKDPGRATRDWPWFTFLGVVALFWICTEPYSMPSVSMEKTLLAGDCLLVDTISISLGRDLHRGDIVVFHYPVNPSEVFVKRVVGIPGDRLRLLHKLLFRNGAMVNEPYASHASTYEDTYRDNFPAGPNFPRSGPVMKMLNSSVVNGEVVVPDGQYFVLGDNRDDSLDSRYWGFVSRTEMIGRPFMIYASYEVKDPSNPLAWRWAFNTRWNRLLKLL